MQMPMSEWFLKAVALCYEQPGRAVERMQAFGDQRGRGALLKKLAVKPGYFGKRLLSSRALHRGGLPAELQREARCAAALLPLLALEGLEPKPVPPKLRRRKSAEWS